MQTYNAAPSALGYSIAVGPRPYGRGYSKPALRASMDLQQCSFLDAAPFSILSRFSQRERFETPNQLS